MNLEETKKYIDRRLSDLGWSIRIDKAGFQTIQKYTGGDKERLNQLYYKMVSVGSRQERREINADTIQIAIDDLRRMNEIVENAPLKLGQNNRADFDRITIEQLASSLEQKVVEEIESEVAKAGKQAAAKAKALDPNVGGNGGGNGQEHFARATTRPAVSEAADETSGKPRILIVDDSPTIRAAVTKALENDFEFVEASDGEKAWKLLRKNPDIKLVVTDLMMPRMDGYDLIKRIRSVKTDARIANLPIIVVTALEDTQAKLRALVVGANDFITKSTDTLELQARILARYQLSQALANIEPGNSRAAATAPTSASPPPRQVAAAMLGTRSAPTIAKQAAKIEIAAKPQGNGGNIPKAGLAAAQVQISPRVAGSAGTANAEPTSVRSWIVPVIEIVEVGYRRLSRIDPTTGITLLASFMVVVTIAGVIFVNRSQVKPSPRLGEVSSAVASANASNSPQTDNVVVPTTGKVNIAPDVAKDARPSPGGSLAMTDPAPVQDRREPVRAEAPKREAQKPKTAVAAAAPVQAPATKRRAADTATEPRAAPAQVPGAAPPAPTAPAPEDPAAPAASVPPTAALAAANTPLPSARLTQAELSALINKFVFVYQAGDIEQFLSLFDDSVRTNDRSSKAGLREDYEGLFRTTVMRQMVLGNVAWEISDRLAQGWSNFEVRVRKENEEEIKVYRGSLTFHVEKNDGRIRITRLFHGQWKAQN